MGARWMRNTFIYLLIVVAVVAIVWSLLAPRSSSTQTKDIGDIITAVQQGQVQSIEVSGDNLTVHMTGDSTTYKSRKESGVSIYEVFKDAGVSSDKMQASGIKVKGSSAWSNLLPLLFNLLPIVIIGAVLIFMLRQAQGSNSQAMSFGKSRARMFSGSKSTVSFVDVAGVDEAKEELQEVVEFLKYPEKFASLGARIPRGVLLVGPPGTGKTLLGKAVAGEASVPFFSISGSEFVEMFVGVGASRVRDLFDQAKRNAPCIVFVDEIDAVGRQRGAGLGGSHDEREQTLNQILVEMDGFDTNTNIIVLAATNRPDILDPALLRPGRFDRHVILDRPDIKGRKAILDVHAKGKPLEKEADLMVLAKQTPGFSGADLANLVNEAALLAARRNKKRVSMAEFNEAVDRVIAGPERKSRVISPKEKEIIAFHEAGHALVARMLPDADRVYKVTIVSRGMTGGFTRFLPEEDRHLGTRTQFQDRLAATLGGHVAEELALGEMTTGPQNDIEQATKIARQMVMQWGMSERLGPRTFGRKEELVFLGREIAEQRNYSEKVAEEIDEEVRRIIDHAYQAAKKILSENRSKLDQLARRLIEVETLEGEELERVFNAPLDHVFPPSEESTSEPPPPPSEEGSQEEETGAEKKAGKPGLAWGGGQAQSRLQPPDKGEEG
jgi:cell division protease FtsH